MHLTAETDHDTPELAQPFKHYRLGRQLGAGGFGEVREAWDEHLRRKVAIKRLKTGGALGHPDSLLREARLAASLDHPAFVKIHAIEEDGNGHAIVMEMIAGVTLRALAANGPLAPDTVCDLAGQAAAAMAAAHARGLVHGDLKPSNLMVDEAGRLRILDLGLAFHDDPQATTSVMQLEQQGTIAYMAPECLLGQAPNRQSDVYALGVVCYEMLCGERPFGKLSGLALAAAQMQSSSASWVFPAATPAPVIELVRAMTARQPAQRPAGMQEVADRLAALQAGAALMPAVPVAALEPAPAAATGPASSAGPAAIAPEPVTAGAPPGAPPGVPLGARWRKAGLGAALALALGLGGWYALQHGPAPVPFSRSATIARALHALETFDQPERLEAARADFEALLARDPNNAAAVAGMSLVSSFRYSADTQDETWLRRADAAAQQARRLEPTLALSHVAQAWVLWGQGAREQALGAVERALVLEPDNFFASYGKMLFLNLMRRDDAARTWGEAMLRKFPKQRVFPDELGTLYYRLGDHKAAEKAFRLSIRLQPDSSLAYANLNAALLGQGRTDEALQVVQQGLQVRPNVALYSNLGLALFQRGDYVGAADAYQRAVTPPVGNPNKYYSWANLGDTLMWIPGREAEAREAYRKAMQLLAVKLARVPDDATLLSRMGLYAARSADAKQAMALTAKALAAAPRSPDVYFRAALAYELLQHRELALQALANAKHYGYPASAVDTEPDFVALRRDPRYPR
jgi:serine/threonine protein kinase/Tfp pilus assembly protein PilF